MTTLENLGTVLESDVLVIGGGVSGLWAAIKAREYVDNVLIVDKGPADWGGLASRAGGDYDAVMPGENVEDWVKDLVYYFDGLCEQDVVEEIFKQSYQRLEDYEKLGHNFVRKPDGSFKAIPQRGLEHVKCCIYRPYGKGGKNMVRVLVDEACRLGVKTLSRTLVTDLFKHNDSVTGAVGFNTLNGEFYIFKARAVILASGGGGWKPSAHSNTATGEGVAMALRAGVEVKNCEFIRVWNSPKQFAWEGQTVLMPLGAKFVNALGETFMDRYSPILGNNTDPHYNVTGMAFEARAGRGPFYLDCSHMKPEDVELVKPGSGWQKLNYEKLLEIGLDVFRGKTEWVPQVRAPYEGIIFDIKGQTGVPGLLAAGRAAPDPGLYMGGWNLCRTAVTGYTAGESAGLYAQNYRTFPPDAAEVEALKYKLFTPSGKPGIAPHEALAKVREIIAPYDVCILKTGKSLNRALQEINNFKENILPRVTAQDSHYLMKLIEVQSITLMTERYLRASLMRTESRAGHYREDYPQRDDAKWLKWIVVSEKNGEFQFRTEPVPFERYKFKPERYYMDNFTFHR